MALKDILSKKRLTAIGVVFGIALVVLVGINFSADDTKEDTIKWGGPKNIAMLPILAQDQGFFAEEGLIAERNDIQTGKMAMDALISGDIDIAVLVETNIAFIEFQPGSNLKVISIIEEKYDDAILARKDNGITTAKDLEGKRLGLTPATTSHAFAIQYLESEGVDLENVTIVNMPPPSIQAALINGELDAGSLWQPLRYNVKAALGDNITEMNDNTAYKAYAILVVNEDYAKDHEDEITKYIKALIKAEQYLNENQEEAQGILAREIDIPLDILKTIWDEYELEVHISKELLDTIENEGRWIVETQQEHKGKAIPEYSDVMAPEYLKKIDATRVEGV